jgi:hypothetical protein
MVFGNLQGAEGGMSTTWLMVNDWLAVACLIPHSGLLYDRKKTHVTGVKDWLVAVAIHQ